MNHREAREMAAGNDASFLHICRSDIDTSETAIHAPETYAKARENLEAFVRKGYLVRDEKPSFYIYRQIMWGRVQTGIVGCASVDEYASDVIKKHELTRREKELDRIEHFDACSAQTEPVFLAYRKHEGLSGIIREWIKFHKPEYDFTTDDGVTHILWPVSDPGTVEAIRKVVEWFAADASHNIVYTYYNPKHVRDVYMVALRDEDGTLIGYYEKHDSRKAETMKQYDLF